MRPFSDDFLRDLAHEEELIVSSREDGRTGSVPVWFVVAPSGVIYLLGEAISAKVRRWRSDPWVRLRAPRSHRETEGVVSFVEGGPELEGVGPAVVERWGMWGATTIEGLRRLIRDRRYVLLRVEAAAD